MVGLKEYLQYVESKNPGCEDPLQEFITLLQADKASSPGSIGLCAGLLTAYAVASSHTRLEFEEYGAAAIRLAMMIGVATDTQDAWRNVEQGEQMKRAINLVHPQAYISVWLDEKRATITTTAAWIRSSILRQFQGSGLTVAESNIQGPIHCPNSESKRHSRCDL